MQDNQTANRGLSLIQDCGYYSSSCGYCKDGDSSVSTGKSAHGECCVCSELLSAPTRCRATFLITYALSAGMHAHRLTVYDYQGIQSCWQQHAVVLLWPAFLLSLQSMLPNAASDQFPIRVSIINAHKKCTHRCTA
jgi:hypothetical protein